MSKTGRSHPPKLLNKRIDTGSKAQAKTQQIYAALDLGTNSCRLLVVKPTKNSFRVIDSFAKSVGLGEGLDATGRLSHKNMNKALSALRVCKSKLEKHDITNIRMVATEACRQAKNGRSFLKKIHRELGLDLEIIPTKEEARLAVIGCASLVNPRFNHVMFADIGGGSTELVWADLSQIEPEDRPRALMRLSKGFEKEKVQSQFPRVQIIDWISIPLGVATLADRFNDVEDDTARFALMAWFFEEHLSTFGPYIDEGFDDEFEMEKMQMIGSSGPMTTIGASYLGLQKYDRSRVDGLSMSPKKVNAVIDGYLLQSKDELEADSSIGAGRSKYVLSGSAIMQTLLRIWPVKTVSVADRGLREGILNELINADGVWAKH